MTREDWLQAMSAKLRGLIASNGGAVPNTLRVSCGFPVGSRSVSNKSKAIGQCWAACCSADSHNEIFISPVLQDSLRVSDVLLHELVHAAVGVDKGHKAPFKHLATSCGLTGKMTATVATPELAERLSGFIAELGEYPHAALNPAESGRKKQGTRMLKIVCPECGYTCRTTQQWIDSGLPTCSACDVPFVVFE